MTSADQAFSSSRARTLPLLALMLLAVLVVVGWWALRRPTPEMPPEIASHASTPGSPSDDRTSPELDDAASESAPTRTANAVETAPVATPSRTDTGRILGTVRAGAESLTAVTSGFARIDPVPPRAGSPRDATEEARLMVGMPTVVIDHAGRFEFPRVPFGDWIVKVEPDGFERRVERVTLTSEITEVQLEFLTRPIRPTQLAIVLLDETGAPFFENVSDEDRVITLVMRPALLPTCPPVGTSLAKSVRGSPVPLVEGLPSDSLTTFTIPDTDSGCACALLGDFVLAAVPYVARQQRVELQLTRADLARRRKTCVVQVVDAASRTPVANANVAFHSALGWRENAVTDSQGWARTGTAIVGSMEIDVECAGYLKANDLSTVRIDEPSQERTIELVRAVTLSGRFQRTNGLSARLHLRLVPIGSKSTRDQKLLRTLDNGEFSIGGLRAGEYVLGLSTIERPAGKSVRRGEVGGWTYVDARNGDVHGIHVEITDELFEQSGIVPRVGDADVMRELMGGWERQR